MALPVSHSPCSSSSCLLPLLPRPPRPAAGATVREADEPPGRAVGTAFSRMACASARAVRLLHLADHEFHESSTTLPRHPCRGLSGRLSRAHGAQVRVHWDIWLRDPRRPGSGRAHEASSAQSGQSAAQGRELRARGRGDASVRHRHAFPAAHGQDTELACRWALSSGPRATQRRLLLLLPLHSAPGPAARLAAVPRALESSCLLPTKPLPAHPRRNPGALQVPAGGSLKFMKGWPELHPEQQCTCRGPLAAGASCVCCSRSRGVHGLLPWGLLLYTSTVQRSAGSPRSQ